jgi:hypothetical protein
VRIALPEARRLALHAQGLDGGRTSQTGKAGVLAAIERLGYVQIDTISVVERAHHHVLWSRRPDYTPDMLHELQASDRAVFEYWTHAASYVPMTHFRYYRPHMLAASGGGRTQHWLQEQREVVDHVLGRIREEGALGSVDFPPPEGVKRGPWWDRTPAKHALEALFNAGILMISERRGFQRVYDLAERVLPPALDLSEPSPEESDRFLVLRSLAAFGVAGAGEIRWGHRGHGDLTPLLRRMAAEGEVVPVEVEGLEGERWALPERLAALEAATPEQRVHILSPFDNLVIRRGRLRELFGFDYTLECYVPAAKRRYGYFCLPLLRGDRFIGRLDAKAERKQRVLVVKKMHFEPDLGDPAALLPALTAELHAFAAFNGCETVGVEDTDLPWGG